MKKFRFVLGCGLFFLTGAYLWRAEHLGLGFDFGGEAREYGSGDPLVLKIGSDKISGDDINVEYDAVLHHLAATDESKQMVMNKSSILEDLMPLKKHIAASMIERKVLFQYIKLDRSFDWDKPERIATCEEQFKASLSQKSNMAKDPISASVARESLCQRSLIEQYLEEKVFHDLAVNHQEIKVYYEQNKSHFKQFETVLIRHILFADEATARRYRPLLTAKNFSEMARVHSISPEGKAGGKLGPYFKGMMPAVFDLAFFMKIGEISEVLRSNYGYHVIILDGKNQKKQLEFSVVESQVRRILLRKKQEEAYERWLEQALATIDVSMPKVSM